MRAIDFVLPGAGLLNRRPVRGGLVLLAWLSLLALVWFRRTRILQTFDGSAVDHWLALGALAGAFCATLRLGREPMPVATDSESQWQLAWRRFRRHRPAMFGLGLVSLLTMAALLTPFLAPYDPAAQGVDLLASQFRPPSLDHPMGTDHFGRDVLSRVLYGGRTSLAIGGLAIAIAITLGTVIGAVAGYRRGWVDAVSMRSVDLLLSFPRLVLLITVVALVESSVAVVATVLGLTGWMATSRLVRGEVLSLREREFIQAAKALGFGAPRILFRHVIPNVASPIIVAATLGIGNTILVEASLSFLGLGVPAPSPSWGGMVARGRDVMVQAPWIALFPGLAIMLTVMSFNLIGDGLRDALDPRSASRGPAATGAVGS